MMGSSSVARILTMIRRRGPALASAMLVFAAACAVAPAQERAVAQESRAGPLVGAKAAPKAAPKGAPKAAPKAAPKGAPKATLTPAERAQIQYGRQIAVAQCSSCHALDDAANSPNPEAPPLRNALWRFERDGLANYFIEALQVGHGDMPLFDFTPIATDALIAYLKSIKTSEDIDEK